MQANHSRSQASWKFLRRDFCAPVAVEQFSQPGFFQNPKAAVAGEGNLNNVVQCCATSRSAIGESLSIPHLQAVSRGNPELTRGIHRQRLDASFGRVGDYL